MGEVASYPVGTFSWVDLGTTDVAGAKAFYGDLLVGGGHAPAPQEGPVPRWTISFRVADADQSAARAQELGGSVLLPPIDIPAGRFAIVADPAGASFSIMAVPGGPLRGVDGS